MGRPHVRNQREGVTPSKDQCSDDDSSCFAGGHTRQVALAQRAAADDHLLLGQSEVLTAETKKRNLQRDAPRHEAESASDSCYDVVDRAPIARLSMWQHAPVHRLLLDLSDASAFTASAEGRPASELSSSAE
eukprot:4862594-Amphidinium_carterae.1